MARIFTLRFDYHNEPRTALVTYSVTEGIESFRIWFMDADLQQIIGGQTFTYEGFDGYTIQESEMTTAAKTLIDIVGKAIGQFIGKTVHNVEQ